MTIDRWRLIETLFLQAAGRPAADRSGFLDQVCNGDGDLRREIESLLSCDVPDERIVKITRPLYADLNGPADSKADLVGRHIGAYRLERLIGHGGMGAVYLGIRDDDQYQKQVAIKLLKRGMDTDFMLHRFRQERQILANLEHPFIARLLDGGATADGLPYFVMEYVDGVPITKYCRETALTVAETLRLFRLVCEAVQHAHQNLVVHRDIKPSNILVTKEGIPKLLDFGIAKVINPASAPGSTLTQAEMRMLTPDYASPEHVKGSLITTASDIYSLAAVLYELLAGQRPHRFASNSLVDIERTICDVDPEKPSVAASQNNDFSPSLRKQLKRQLSGDLDNIVLTGMRKEPQRRYASATEFSEDVHRHLEFRPIVAHEDRWSYRVGKFIRRHRLGVIAATLIVASLIGGIVSTTVQARRSERRFQIVRQLANSMLFDIHDEVQQLPGSTRVRALIIETVLRYLDNLAKDAGQDTGLKLEIAKAYRRIGAIEGHPSQANLGRTGAARGHYKKALEVLAPLADDSATRVASVEETVRVNIEIGDIEMTAGNLEAAKRFFGSAAAPVDLVPLSADTEVYVHFRLGDIEAQQGSPENAVPHFRQALERAQAWAGVSNRPEAHRQLHAAYRRLANASHETGDLLACRDNLYKAQEIIEARLRRTPSSVEDLRSLFTTHIVLGEVLAGPDNLNFGDYHAAVNHYRASVAIAEQFVSADKDDVRARRDLAISYRRLGRVLFEESPAEASTYYTKAHAIAEGLTALDPASVDFRRDLVEANLGLGMLSKMSGRKGEALERLTLALEAQKSIEAAAPNRIWVARYITQIYTEIGNTLTLSGDTAGALKNYEDALAAADRLLKRAPTSLYLERDRADVLEVTGQYFATLSAQPGLTEARRSFLRAEARTYLERSMTTWQRWNQEHLAAPYASHRQNRTMAALASISRGRVR